MRRSGTGGKFSFSNFLLLFYVLKWTNWFFDLVKGKNTKIEFRF